MSKIVYEVTVECGNVYWRLNGKLHREDGPAIESADGSKFWYVNGELHRSDGPAREWANGDKEWYVNGDRHRLDGPACEYASGDKWWYIDGVKYTEEDFRKKIAQMKSPVAQSCAGKAVEIEGRRYQLVDVTGV